MKQKNTNTMSPSNIQKGQAVDVSEDVVGKKYDIVARQAPVYDTGIKQNRVA